MTDLLEPQTLTNLISPAIAQFFLQRLNTYSETVSSAPQSGASPHLHKPVLFRDAIKANIYDLTRAVARERSAESGKTVDDEYAVVIRPIMNALRDAKSQNNPDAYYNAMDQFFGSGVVCRTYQTIPWNDESCIPSNIDHKIHLDPNALRMIAAQVPNFYVGNCERAR